MGISIPGTTNEQCQKFEQYLSLLLKWNKTHNLTAIRSADDVVKRHFMESIALIPHLGSPKTVLDLGTGGGFPGLPIAIMRPDWRVTVLDSVNKKITFCQEVIRVCGLTNAKAVAARADDPSTVQQLSSFDVVMSRATWSMAEYLPIALPYVHRPNSIIVAMKGPRYPEELSQVSTLPADIHGPEVQSLSGGGKLLEDLVVIKYWAE